MEAVIYARVSSVTDRQSTDRQVVDLRSYANTNNMNIVKVFEEHISGVKKNEERPILCECLDFCVTNNIDILLNRIEQENIQEVILATDSTLDGETTAQYLSNLLSSKNLNVYRIGYGLPYGSEIDYLDKFTIERAIKNKNKLN